MIATMMKRSIAMNEMLIKSRGKEKTDTGDLTSGDETQIRR